MKNVKADSVLAMMDDAINVMEHQYGIIAPRVNWTNKIFLLVVLLALIIEN